MKASFMQIQKIDFCMPTQCIKSRALTQITIFKLHHKHIETLLVAIVVQVSKMQVKYFGKMIRQLQTPVYLLSVSVWPQVASSLHIFSLFTQSIYFDGLDVCSPSMLYTRGTLYTASYFSLVTACICENTPCHEGITMNADTCLFE